MRGCCALAQARLTQLHEEMPAATPEILERETQDFLADVELFLEAEIDETQSTPSGSRCRSGVRWTTTKSRWRGRSPSRSRLAPDSRSASPAAWIASTKSAPPPSRCSTTRPAGSGGTSGRACSPAGSRLQHALYGLAAVELLKARYKKPRVTGGRLLLLQPQGTPGARQDPCSHARVDRGRAGRPARRDHSRDSSPARRDEDNCRYCDYVAACGGRANAAG